MNVYLISAVLLQVSLCYAYPNPRGVGAYAYQDSNGHRYGGTVALKDDFNPFDYPFPAPFNDVDSFFPKYFTNFENLLQPIFGSDIESQRLALYAARKAYDLTYNDGLNTNFFRMSNFGSVPPFFGFPPFDMGDNIYNNAAFASSFAGPGITRQSAAIYPQNSNMPNVDITHQTDEDRSNYPGKYYSVSSSSYASSSNVNGKVKDERQAETVVNNNGKITKYKVHS